MFINVSNFLLKNKLIINNNNNNKSYFNLILYTYLYF